MIISHRENELLIELLLDANMRCKKLTLGCDWAPDTDPFYHLLGVTEHINMYCMWLRGFVELRY